MSMPEQIRNFWDRYPCGESLVGKNDNWEAFFRNYDSFRYRTEGHILNELDRLDVSGRSLLEIGIGQAADSEQLIRRGALWHGLDFSAEAVARAKHRFALFALPYRDIQTGSAERIPYPDDSFDVIYSHGVLHHIPNIRAVNRELRRVLKPDGRAAIMLYAKNSLNYRLSVNVIRRALMVLLWGFATLGGQRWIRSEVLRGHLANARQFGLLNYLRNPLFMMRNTDGPANPYSKVYDLADVAEDFSEFSILDHRVHFLNERQMPFLRVLPTALRQRLASRYGWHLWVFLGKKET